MNCVEFQGGLVVHAIKDHSLTMNHLHVNICVFSPQSKAFEKKANQVKQKKRFENNRMKVVATVVAVVIGAIIIGVIIYAIVSSAEQ